jgi:uncharacterized protein YukE
MASIHMDIETCQGVLNQIEESHRLIQEALDDTSLKVNAIVGSDWVANSARLFQNQYSEIMGHIDSQLKFLEEFETRLGEAISVMKEAADHLD